MTDKFNYKFYCKKCHQVNTDIDEHRSEYGCCSDSLLLVPEDLICVVDRLVDLGFEISISGCLEDPSNCDEQQIESELCIYIVLAVQYPQSLFDDDMPQGWLYRTGTARNGHTTTAITNTQIKHWNSLEEKRRYLRTAAAEFVKYLKSKDRGGTRAVLMLM